MLGEPDTTVLHRMNQLQQHRGPDDQGVWSDGQLGFSHARLKQIVDVVSSQQPMHGLQGAVLVVNGEIYNHKELRSRHPSYPYTTTGDSESILALHASATSHSTGRLTANEHAVWIGQLDGMYAFALWDAPSQQLLLARDPMGIKPWCEPNWETIFCLQAKPKLSEPMNGTRQHWMSSHLPPDWFGSTRLTQRPCSKACTMASSRNGRMLEPR